MFSRFYLKEETMDWLLDFLEINFPVEILRIEKGYRGWMKNGKFCSIKEIVSDIKAAIICEVELRKEEEREKEIKKILESDGFKAKVCALTEWNKKVAKDDFVPYYCKKLKELEDKIRINEEKIIFAEKHYNLGIFYRDLWGKKFMEEQLELENTEFTINHTKEMLSHIIDRFENLDEDMKGEMEYSYFKKRVDDFNSTILQASEKLNLLKIKQAISIVEKESLQEKCDCLEAKIREFKNENVLNKCRLEYMKKFIFFERRKLLLEGKL